MGCLTGPSVSPASAMCRWNSASQYFRCVIKTPTGARTGKTASYSITATENLGAGFMPAPSAGTAVNPETIYFK